MTVNQILDTSRISTCPTIRSIGCILKKKRCSKHLSLMTSDTKMETRMRRLRFQNGNKDKQMEISKRKQGCANWGSRTETWIYIWRFQNGNNDIQMKIPKWKQGYANWDSIIETRFQKLIRACKRKFQNANKDIQIEFPKWKQRCTNGNSVMETPTQILPFEITL